MAEKQPIFGAGLVSKSEQTSSQYRLNMYSEIKAIEDKTRVEHIGTPGTTQFSDLGLQPVRAWVVVDVNVYALAGDTFYCLDSTGVWINIATITSTTDGPVSMIWTGSHVFFVDGIAGYTYDPVAPLFVQVSSGDFPNGASTSTWHDGYTIVETANEFAISALDDPTTWDAIARAAAESNPDDLVRVFADRGYILLFGEKNTELWGNIGSADFPYQRVGGGIIERGLAARWSVQKFRDGVIGLFKNGEGDVEVGMVQGGGYQKISTPDIDTIFNRYRAPSDAEGLVYRHSGHSFYQINFSLEGKSWVYDADSSLWSELKTNGGRHIAALSESYLGRTMVASYSDGLIYRFDASVYTDAGMMIEREIIGKHIFQEEYFTINRLWVDVDTGVGLATGQGSNPTLMLRVSKDGGKSYGEELTTTLGAVGEYQTRAAWRRLGRGRSFTFKLRYTDPTKFIVRGEGWMR